MSRTPLPPATPPWPLLGREREVKTLATAIDDPACGGIALIGPAGVGKTRLAQQAASMAADRGLPTVPIRASRSASAIPLAALAPLFTYLAIPPDDSGNPLRVVLGAVVARQATERLVLVVDDAQELDHVSVAVLDQLVGRDDIFIVLTVRAGEADPALGDLWRDERIWRVQLDTLADRDLSSLVRLALGGPVDTAALRALVKGSDGNVLFLRDLLKGAIESGILVADRGIWRLSGSLVKSPRLQDVIDSRLQGLSDPERRVLELVALGEPLEFELLGTFADASVVESLEARGLLEAAGNRRLEVRLAHPLYGEVVRSQLPALRRSGLCRALADAAEASGLEGNQHVLRIAVWRLDGGGGKASAMLAAARVALLGEDFQLAARLARVAWEQGGVIDAAILLADASDLSGGAEDVEAILRRAYPIATTDSDRSRIAVRLSSWLFVWLGRPDEASRILNTAQAEIIDPASLAMILVQQADHLLLGGDVVRAIDLCREILEGQPDSFAYAQTSRDLGVALALAGKTTEAIRLTEKALSAQRGLRLEEQIAVAGIFLVALALALGEAGRLNESATTARVGHSASVDRRNRDGQGWFSAILGWALLNQGQLVDSDNYFREAATVFQDLGHPARRWGLGGMALTAGQQGDAERAVAAIRELDDIPEGAVAMMNIHVERGRAWAAVAAGDLPSARSTLWSAVDLAESWGQLSSAAAALHDLVRIGAGPTAARRLEEMADSVDGDLMSARVTYACAVLTSEPDAAAEASRAFERIGALLFAAEAAVLEQRLCLDRGLRRRATAAGSRAELLVRDCGGARTPALMASGDRVKLSRRERDVALLAAEGLSSREIAERLFVSPRTIDNHLQGVYLKLGITGRGELAEYLANFPLSPVLTSDHRNPRTRPVDGSRQQ
jgi:DNA-binding CsgD family transcriptional regulator/tetratricopeptide (TPR) repeat protein